MMKNPQIKPVTSKSVLQIKVWRVSDYFLFVFWVMLMFCFGLLKSDQRTVSICRCNCSHTKEDGRSEKCGPNPEQQPSNVFICKRSPQPGEKDYMGEKRYMSVIEES